MVNPFIKETTTTSGTGNLTLTSINGFATFLNAFSANSSIVYAIENGNNKETGIGIIRAGGVLERTTPIATLVAGVYDITTPAAINLVGSSTVFCDLNASASASTDGFLTKEDWAAFTAKVDRSGDTMTGKLTVDVASGDAIDLQTASASYLKTSMPTNSGGVKIINLDFVGDGVINDISVVFEVLGSTSSFIFRDMTSGTPSLSVTPGSGTFTSTTQFIQFTTGGLSTITLNDSGYSFTAWNTLVDGPIDLGDQTVRWNNLFLLGGITTSIVTNTTGTYTVPVTASTIIQTTAASVYTFPSAASYTGKTIHIVTQFAGTVTSASSNVVPLAGGAAGTAILAATAGKYAKLQSNGTNWVIIEAN